MNPRMDLKKLWDNGKNKIGIPKMALLLVCGFLLLVLSWPQQKEQKTVQTEPQGTQTANRFSEEKYVAQLEEKAARLIESMAGIEKAQVVIVLKSSAEKVVQKNTQSSSGVLTEQDQQGGSRNSREEALQEEAVLADGVPYVIQEIKPEIAGIAVSVRGADSAAVISEIHEALQALFDLPAHRIKVLRMD